MALPTSGTLYMNGRHADNVNPGGYDQGIYIEKVGPPSPNDGIGQAAWEAAYGSSSGAYPLRLKELADGTQAGTINISNLNANKPDTSNPQRMSEFYHYDDTNTVLATPGSFLNISNSGSTGNSVTVKHAKYSPWTILNSGMPASWVTITAGSGQSFLGNGSITFNVSSNSSTSTRSTSIVITYTVGTSTGTHYPTVGSDSTTTRTISISQQAGSGGGSGPPPPGGGRENP